MKEKVIDFLCSHRSIREFAPKAVEANILEKLYEVVCCTASSLGMQQSSVIRVTDPEKKAAIAEIATQEYIARAPELWIYCADTHRNTEILKQKDALTNVGFDADHFFQGVTDAALTAQNVNVAVEALEMGGVFIGSILNHTKKIVELLELPEGVFPVLGYIFGYPGQNPQKKPRMPKEYRIFENQYGLSENIVSDLAPYDAIMNTYYDLRDANRRVDTFTDQVVTKYAKSNPIRCELLTVAKEQGFQLEASDKD